MEGQEELIKWIGRMVISRRESAWVGLVPGSQDLVIKGNGFGYFGFHFLDHPRFGVAFSKVSAVCCFSFHMFVFSVP